VSRIVAAYSAWQELTDDLAAARDLAAEDESFAEEIPGMEERLAVAQERLRRLLIPRDPDDGRDVIMEIKAGEGGAESALFAGDLLRMYLHYAESKGWKTELLDRTESDLGGYKDVQVAIKGNSSDPAQGVWAHLKYEGGVHRVQRVPATESQGRIHTSAAGVLVFPEVDEPEEVAISQNDLKIDVFRSSGPGGQSVNTTDSAVRITHLPTGIVVSMQNEKSQLQNREAAMRVLRARILAAQQEAAEAEASAARKSQIRTVDRSERIRTYNFPENRIADHRTGYKAYNLDQVMDGALEPIVQSAITADEEARLAALATTDA
jgi:peptide chain release factor 1